ncbi:hypothetical protein BCR34DRAFT_596439 [Clohesyomyces aquaticus]|uniref:DUF6590 domain-containing protein n=1 Tax=Clohesyomyces aquaticus TaxID=1231657 RepID=A0A1Y2A6T0_9PLEO|nr:hypothetical protein BCR34DRAFT_596439 [Clohesyomyces aquaticus]
MAQHIARHFLNVAFESLAWQDPIGDARKANNVISSGHTDHADGRQYRGKIANTASGKVARKDSIGENESKSENPIMALQNTVRDTGFATIQPTNWTWSEAYQDYYHTTYNQWGQPIYHWSKNLLKFGEQASCDPPFSQDIGRANEPSTHNVYYYGAPPSMKDLSAPTSSIGHSVRSDSGVGPRASPELPPMPEPVSNEIRVQLSGLISGTPAGGWYELLDSSYRMRTRPEAREFFVTGRVFSMLVSKALNEGSARHNADDDAITVVRYGEDAYAQIRRFVIVKVRESFFYACPISSYGGRGTAKAGCNPLEHAPVYFSGSNWAYCQGEYQNGMRTEGIEVVPSNPNQYMDPALRVRFGKLIAIEWNVKVKDIGMVIDEHRSALVKAARESLGTD